MASNDATIDALTSSFDATFNVTNRINDPTKPHPRYSLYKNRGDIGNQEKRRQRVLQEQKKRRDDYLRFKRHYKLLNPNMFTLKLTNLKNRTKIIILENVSEFMFEIC